MINGGTYDGKRVNSIQHSDYQYTKYILSAILKYAFSFQRQIGYEETFFITYRGNYRDNKFRNMIDVINSISDKDFKEAVDEVKRIYNHVQKMLKIKKLVEDDNCIRVYRTLNEIEISQIVPSLNILTTFKFQSNFLVSGTYDGGIYNKQNSLKVHFRLPAEMVWIHPDFIVTEMFGENEMNNINYYTRFSALDYEKEILFVNLHPKGILEFSIDDIINNTLNLSEIDLDKYPVKEFIMYNISDRDIHWQIFFDCKLLLFNDQYYRVKNFYNRKMKIIHRSYMNFYKSLHPLIRFFYKKKIS